MYYTTTGGCEESARRTSGLPGRAVLLPVVDEHGAGTAEQVLPDIYIYIYIYTYVIHIYLYIHMYTHM